MYRKNFVVTRQEYYYSGARVVEIETRGWDYVGTGALVLRYSELGEGDTFDDPREAAMVAYRVWREWVRDEDDVQMSFGTTGGIGTEHDPQDTDENDNPIYMTPIQVFMHADAAWENLPKCEYCGDVLGEDRYGNEFSEDEYPYCSEYCAEEAARAWLDEITVAVVCEACGARLPKDTRGWCDICGADFMTLRRVYEGEDE